MPLLFQCVTTDRTNLAQDGFSNPQHARATNLHLCFFGIMPLIMFGYLPLLPSSLFFLFYFLSFVLYKPMYCLILFTRKIRPSASTSLLRFLKPSKLNIYQNKSKHLMRRFTLLKQDWWKKVLFGMAFVIQLIQFLKGK